MSVDSIVFVIKFQEFVSIVSKNVHMMEEHVNKAEAKMGSLSGIKKMITSLVSPVSKYYCIAQSNGVVESTN